MIDGNVTDAVEVKGGIIVSVVKEADWHKKQRSRVKVIDYGEAVLMPGLVDVYVILNQLYDGYWNFT